VITEPGNERAPDTGGGNGWQVTYFAREQVIRTLKVAMTQGRLTEDEYETRAAQASASRSPAELDALTADLPAGLVTVRPPTGRDVLTGVCVIIAAVSVVGAIVLWSPDNYAAFALALLALATLIVVPVITVGLAVDARHQKRSRKQLPPYDQRSG